MYHVRLRALFDAAIEAYQSHYGCFALRALQQDGTARAAIEQLLTTATVQFTSKDTPTGCMVVLSAINCTKQDADVFDSISQRRNGSADAIRDRILLGVSRGETPAGFDAEPMAALVIATFQGLSIRARDGASRAELECAVKLMMSLWPS